MCPAEYSLSCTRRPRRLFHLRRVGHSPKWMSSTVSGTHAILNSLRYYLLLSASPCSRWCRRCYCCLNRSRREPEPSSTSEPQHLIIFSFFLLFIVVVSEPDLEMRCMNLLLPFLAIVIYLSRSRGQVEYFHRDRFKLHLLSYPQYRISEFAIIPCAYNCLSDLLQIC